MGSIYISVTCDRKTWRVLLTRREKGTYTVPPVFSLFINSVEMKRIHNSKNIGQVKMSYEILANQIVLFVLLLQI